MKEKSRNTNENNEKNINKKSNKKTNKKVKKKTSIVKKLFYVLLLIIIAMGVLFTYKVYQNGGGVSGIIATAIGHDMSTKEELEDFKCLILGISTDQEDVYLTDTIMIASYNPNTQKASLMSIPRDTYVGTNPSKATPYEKINAFYSRKNRPDETLEAVNEITGLDIEHYVVVKTEALIEMVDVIDGVTFNVPIDMKYTDTSQDLYIDLKAGEQVLNGDQAEQLLRFRQNSNGTTYPEEYGTGDTGRMRTQREFMEAVANQMLKPENIFKLNDILDVVIDNVITNVDFDYIKDYIPYAVEFSTADLQTATLPGVNTNNNSMGTWIYRVDEDETEELIKEMFVNRDLVHDGTEVDLSEVEINIVNATGYSSKLEEIVDKAEMSDMEVATETTSNVISQSTIIYPVDVSEATIENIKTSLGLKNVVMSKSDDSTTEITVIVGEDYII